MTLTYLGKTYECVSAEKKQNEIIIRTGEVVDGEEVVYHIYGDINFGEVVLDGGTWTESSEPGDVVTWSELNNAYQEGVDSV